MLNHGVWTSLAFSAAQGIKRLVHQLEAEVDLCRFLHKLTGKLGISQEEEAKAMRHYELLMTSHTHN